MTRTIHSRVALALGVVGLAAAGATAAQAQQAQSAAPAAPAAADIDRTPADCVLVNRVAKNVAVNDRQIVFFMRGDTYYRNDLDAACQSLTAGETRLVYHYRNAGSPKLVRLCDTDAFTVERQTSRIGCGVGKFIPITAAEAAALTGQPVAAPAASPAPAANSSRNEQRSERPSRRERN
jgi:hypothetical protein